MRLSPTALQSWLDCKRRFWFERVIGRKQPPTDAMELGTAVHTEVETYLLTGEWPEYQPDERAWLPSRIAQAGAPFLEPLRAEVAAETAEVEPPFSFPAGVVGPFPFSGRIDLRLWGSGPRIVDHKTTSDLGAYWHLDADGMRNNLQLRLYAALGFPEDTASVRVGHIYYLTKPPFGSRELHVDVTAEDLKRTREDAVTVATEIERVTSILDMDRQSEIPSRTANCRKYGGCPHRDYCHDSPVNAAKQTENLLRRVNAVALPPRLPMPFFDKKPALPAVAPSLPLAAKPAPTPAPITIAPGQISPPDAPRPDPGPTLADKLRKAFAVAGVPSVALTIARSAAVQFHATDAQVDDAFAEGSIRGFWSIADGRLTLTGAPTPTETPAPAPAPKPVDPARDAAVAEVEAFCKTFGDDRVVATAKNLGLARWRKAGSAKLAELLTALRSMTSTVTGDTSASDVDLILTQLRASAAQPDFQPSDIDAVDAEDIRQAIAEGTGATVADDRVMACIIAGDRAGWWRWSADHPAAGEGAYVEPRWSQIMGRADAPPAPKVPALSTQPPEPPTETIPVHSSDPRHVAVSITLETPPSFVFVGCIPSRGDTVTLETWLDDTIARLEGSEDPDFHRYNVLPRTLASEVKVALRLGQLRIPDMLVVPPRHPYADHLVPILQAFGAIVVRSIQ